MSTPSSRAMHSPAEVLIANKCIEAYKRCSKLDAADGLVRFFQEINTGNSRVSADIFLSQGRIAGVRYTLNDGALAPVSYPGGKIKFGTDENAPNFGAGKGSIFAKSGWLPAFNAQHDLQRLEACATIHELQTSRVERNFRRNTPAERMRPALATKPDTNHQTEPRKFAAPYPASRPEENKRPQACLYSTSIYTAYGCLTPEEVAQTAKTQGFTHVALTDVATLTGVPRFVRACKDLSLTPLVGTDIAVRGVPGTPADKDTRMTLIVQDAEGWRNMCVLLTAASLNKNMATSNKELAMNALAWVGWEDLRQLSGGLVAFSRGAAGPLQRSDDVVQTRDALVAAFGQANVCADAEIDGVQLAGSVAIQASPHQPPDMADARWQFFQHSLASALEDAAATRTIEALESGRSDAGSTSTATDMAIAQRCKPLDDAWALTPPRLALPQGNTAHGILTELAREGLRLRLEQAGIDEANALAKEYEERIEHELAVIDKMGFSDYFLIVYGAAWESRVLGAGKSGGVFVRGSAACSAVLWSLGASQVDPVRHKLPFERFLNDKRKVPPDVDMDTPKTVLPMLREWLLNTSLREDQALRTIQSNVGISEYSMLGDNGAITTAAAMCDNAALGKALVDWCNTPVLNRATGRRSRRFLLANVKKRSRIWLLRKNVANIARDIKAKPDDLRRLIALAALIRGAYIRAENRHPSGVVLANRFAPERFPCIATSGGSGDGIVLQHALDTEGAEFFGDVKFDILSSAELARQSDVINLINERHAGGINHNAWGFLGDETAPDMQRALSVIEQKRLQALFQFDKETGSKAVEIVNKLLSRKGKQWGFNAVAYANALVRPGADLSQDTPSLRYQEDIIGQIAKFTGLDLGSADLVRRNLEKGSFSGAQKKLFTESALKAGHTQREVDEEISRLTAVSGYTFNKAHAASYALIILRGAWLKANFPKEFAAIYTRADEQSKKTAVTDAPGSPSQQEQAAAIARVSRPDPMPRPPDVLMEHTEDGAKFKFCLQAAPSSRNGYVPPTLTGARAVPQPSAEPAAPDHPQPVSLNRLEQMRSHVEAATAIWQSALEEGRDLRSDAAVMQAVQDFCPEGSAADDVLPSAILIHDVLSIGGVRPGWGAESLQFFFKTDRQQAEHMQMVAEAIQERHLGLEPQGEPSATCAVA